MITGRSPLALTYTALAFGIVVAPYCFFGLLIGEQDPLRLYMASTLLACTSMLVLRLVGWSKLDGWLAQTQNKITRVLIDVVTVIAFLWSSFILVSLAALSVMFTEFLKWFYILVAVGICAMIALLPIIVLKPSRFERTFSSRLTARLNPFRLAAYGFLLVLAGFACEQVIKFYNHTHPVY